MNEQEAYKILGLANNASVDDIKAAYRAMAQKYSSEVYAVSPMKEEAEAKMRQADEAFDLLVGNIRMGADSNAGKQAAGGRYAYIRQAIANGSADQALSQLQAIPNGQDDAEWNFLMGSAYYYKGWAQQAMQYFETACRLDPSNAEYRNAYQNLRSNANGDMHRSNPYANAPYQTQATAGCGCCDMCAAMMCMDMCCSCTRGGC